MSRVSPAAPRDLPSLVALEDCFPAAQRWSAQSWSDELSASNRHTVVCRAGEMIDAVATFAATDDVVDLHRIITAPRARRRGLAGELLTAGIAWAQVRGARRMLLEVEDTNAAALGLYDCHGFARIAERANYYGPGAHAVILQREIEGETS